MGCSPTLEGLIKRQRTIAADTFALREERAVDAARRGELAEAERALRDDTESYLADLARRVGTGPERLSMAVVLESLARAAAAMGAAVEALAGERLEVAFGHEERGLGHLLDARRSIRRFLSEQSSSSSPSEFAQKLRQAIRLPEQNTSAEESARELARAAEKLAGEERAIERSLGANPGEENRDTGPRERQEGAVRAGEALRERLARNRDATELARGRMESALREMREAARELSAGGDDAARASLERAAQALERLAVHLDGLQPGDVVRRMEALRARAACAAGACDGPSDARREETAADAETLEDWLVGIGREMRTDDPPAAARLAALGERQGLSTLALDVRRAGKAAAQGDAGRAARMELDAAGRFRGLAEAIDLEKRRMLQGLLERLLAAEAEAAALKAGLGKSEADGAEVANARTSDDVSSRSGVRRGPRLARHADALAAFGDAQLNELAEKLREALRGQGDASGGGSRPGGSGGVLVERLGPIVERLQVMVVEVVRRTMVLDRDDRVPDRYRTLVEKYFKALSDDMR